MFRVEEVERAPVMCGWNERRCAALEMRSHRGRNWRPGARVPVKSRLCDVACEPSSPCPDLGLRTRSLRTRSRGLPRCSFTRCTPDWLLVVFRSFVTFESRGIGIWCGSTCHQNEQSQPTSQPVPCGRPPVAALRAACAGHSAPVPISSRAYCTVRTSVVPPYLLMLLYMLMQPARSPAFNVSNVSNSHAPVRQRRRQPLLRHHNTAATSCQQPPFHDVHRILPPEPFNFQPMAPSARRSAGHPCQNLTLSVTKRGCSQG